MTEIEADWRALADDLESHGVPAKRAEVVAMAATGHSYRAIADCEGIGVSSAGGVSNYVDDYREQLTDAEWLAANGPDI